MPVKIFAGDEPAISKCPDSGVGSLLGGIRVSKCGKGYGILCPQGGMCYCCAGKGGGWAAKSAGGAGKSTDSGGKFDSFGGNFACSGGFFYTRCKKSSSFI